MALKITRALQKLFASNAGINSIAEYGSLAAGLPQRYSGGTITAAIVQNLSNYLTGWTGAVVGSNSPAIEDRNALDWLFSRQIAYLLQTGVAEYDATTEYFIGSLVNDGLGNIYVSRTNNNLGNALTNEANWLAVLTNSVVSRSVNTTVATREKTILVSGTHDETLPDAATCTGRDFFFTKTDAVGTTVTFLTTGGQTMSGVASGGVTLTEQWSWARFTSIGTGWVVQLG